MGHTGNVKRGSLSGCAVIGEGVMSLIYKRVDLDQIIERKKLLWKR